MSECLIRLREGGAIAFVHAVYLTLMPQAVRLRHNLLCLAVLRDRARAAKQTDSDTEYYDAAKGHLYAFL